MRGYLSPANLVTSGNLVAGFATLILATREEFVWAAGCVGVAAVLDVVDGMVARRSRAECEFGANLDSLADLVTFGAAPAFTLYLSALEGVPVAGIGACLAFLLCGAWRLARFPLAAKSRWYFVGLPIPLAGVIVMTLAALAPSTGVILGVTLALALLMVSVLPFPTWSELARLARADRRVEVEETPATPE
ncbi:MAG: CDP-diacylglycerol--serine O-phosphatidyltransferase [Actinomycetota bacterium]|nr:CDP-diacylglycerol--serine O-phosphatidyltransferase [Actinomycetota bacterium]